MLKFLHHHYLNRYHGVYRSAKKLFVFDLALLSLTLAMIAGNLFLFFWKPSLTGLIELSMTLGNERIKSGEEVIVTVSYTNHSKINLKEASLGLRLPEGFIINRDKTPTDVFSDQSIFTSVKELGAGASGQASVYGSFWTEPNEDALIIANLSYRPENKSSREQKLSSLITKLPESVLSGYLKFPSSAFARAPIKFSYTIKNSGNREIKDIYILTSKRDEVMLNEDLVSIPPNGSKTIEGQFTAPSQTGYHTFEIATAISYQNSKIFQTKNIQEFQIFSPQINSAVKLISPPPYAEPGQIIPVEASWKNNSGIKLQNLSLHLTSNLQGIVDWKKTAQENHAKTEANGVFFDGQSRTSLSNGNPESNDVFGVKIYLLPKFNLPQTENAKLEIFPIMKAEAPEISDQAFSQEGSRVSLPLATELNFNSIEARYYTNEGDQLGRGSLPPQVGKMTKYWIFVKVINTTNAVDNPSFSTSLPDGVEFSGKQSTTIGPQLKYNNSSRTISWSYDSLPANSQTGLYFEVAVTPTASQIGKNIQLTNSLSFSATDSFVGKKFNLSHTPINNILNRNDRGFSLGSKVVP
ncbi:MAG: DUF11 domain-containing protein [Candidatus Magasanikbacteria bacterium]|nr:DUF11 domain-containing protein [Candidatus Magasanikbacteria bacterium]